MGHNIEMLNESAAQKGDDDVHSARLELEECIHFHTDAVRLVFTTEELLKMVDIFDNAKKEILGMGSPSFLKHMVSFGNVVFGKPCLHNDRVAVEVTLDGTIHIHHKNLRLHFSQMDFYDFADSVMDAGKALCQHLKTEIDINGAGVVYHPVTENHIKLLHEYVDGKYPKANAEDVTELKYKMRRYEVLPKGDSTVEADLQRPTGRLPDKFPGDIPVELDRNYLFSLYESIVKWGYASGPFYGDFIPAYKYSDGRVYLKGAHRAAVLKVSGYTKINVMMSTPPTAWVE